MVRLIKLFLISIPEDLYSSRSQYVLTAQIDSHVRFSNKFGLE